MERGRSKRNGKETRYAREERNWRELRAVRGDRYDREDRYGKEDSYGFEQSRGLEAEYTGGASRYNNKAEYGSEEYGREERRAGNGEAERGRQGKHNPYQRLFGRPGKERYRVRRRTFEDDIESLELIRERFPVSYRKAKEVLDMVGGEVTEAIAYLEEEGKETVDYVGEAVERTSDYLLERGGELTDQFRGFWDWANNTTVTIRRGDEVMARIPATLGLVGLAGTLFSSRLAVVGAIGLASILSSGYNLELDSRQDSKMDQ